MKTYHKIMKVIWLVLFVLATVASIYYMVTDGMQAAALPLVVAFLSFVQLMVRQFFIEKRINKNQGK